MQPTPSLRDQGVQALQEGNLDRAIDLLARAVMADDQDAEAKAVLGIAYSQKGLHAQAKRALQTATEIQPHNPNFRYNLGVILERAGDKQGAAIAFRDTLQLNPQHGQAKAKLQAMGPEVHGLLASAPKPIDPAGAIGGGCGV
jgi:Flp pilus assembly protein TadD